MQGNLPREVYICNDVEHIFIRIHVRYIFSTRKHIEPIGPERSVKDFVVRRYPSEIMIVPLSFRPFSQIFMKTIE